LVAAGKIKKLPDLYLLRQHHLDTNCYREDQRFDRFDRMLWDTWSYDFMRFVDAVATLVAEKDSLTKEEAVRLVKQGYRRYITPLILGALNTTSERRPAPPPPPLSPSDLIQDRHVVSIQSFLTDPDAVRQTFAKPPAPEAQSTAVLLEAANQHLQRDNWQAALEAFQAASVQAPPSAETLVAMGNCLLRLNRTGECLPYFQRAAELVTNSADIYAYLGFAYEVNTQPQAAERAYLQALTLNPKHRVAGRNLGGLHLRQGRIGEGLQLLETLFQRYPDEVPGRLMLAAICESMGDRASAGALYQQVLQYDPQNVQARQALAQLKHAQSI
jgi:tetratricopeptide (TPR) repeat protein